MFPLTSRCCSNRLLASSLSLRYWSSSSWSLVGGENSLLILHKDDRRWIRIFPHTPLLHLLLHVDALFLQQLPLSEGPVDRFCRRLSTWGPLSLQASLLRVIKAEHMAFPHDDTVSWNMHITVHTWLCLLFFNLFIVKNKTRPPNVPDRRTMRPVTLFPLTYVSAPSHGSKTTHPVRDKFYTCKAMCKCMNVNLVL